MTASPVNTSPSPPFALVDGVDYETAKTLVKSPDPEVRRQLATQPSLRPELLYFLANDVVPAVRCAIAANPATPRHADVLLVSDGHEEVRSALGRKIARLVPDMPADQVGRIERMTLNILQALARDQAVMVRRILAETLKDVANAPVDVINRLARDVELTVAGPVLESSPVLNDEDLLAIIQETRNTGALGAIARRSSVAPAVADAIALSNNVDAIALLLANPSAQIREETLDRLISRAPAHHEWHAPLVHRPSLPPGAVKRLAGFVAESLLGVLRERSNLDPATLQEVTLVVRRRLEGADLPDPFAPALPAGAEPQGLDKVLDRPAERVQRLLAEGALNEDAIDTGLLEGDAAFVFAALAELAALPLTTVQEIVEARNNRGMTALAWKAGLSMRFAYKLQLRLAHIPPQAALHPAADDSYPLSVEDMLWQLRFFGGM